VGSGAAALRLFCAARWLQLNNLWLLPARVPSFVQASSCCSWHSYFALLTTGASTAEVGAEMELWEESPATIAGRPALE